jgi:hypothetical protein
MPCQKDKGLDTLALFYDVYVKRPGLQRQFNICLPF